MHESTFSEQGIPMIAELNMYLMHVRYLGFDIWSFFEGSFVWLTFIISAKRVRTECASSAVIFLCVKVD